MTLHTVCYESAGEVKLTVNPPRETQRANRSGAAEYLRCIYRRDKAAVVGGRRQG